MVRDLITFYENKQGEADNLQKFIIKGEAVSKGRPRFTRSGHTYTPKRTKDYERLVATSLKAQGAEYSEKPLTMKVDIYKGYLKSWTIKQRERAKSGELQPFKRPDVDNYVKAILDGADKILYKDDAQIIRLEVEKHYDEPARVEIQIKEYEENENDK